MDLYVSWILPGVSQAEPGIGLAAAAAAAESSSSWMIEVTESALIPDSRTPDGGRPRRHAQARAQARDGAKLGTGYSSESTRTQVDLGERSTAP